jgi:hypothetical protein
LPIARHHEHLGRGRQLGEHHGVGQVGREVHPDRALHGAAGALDLGDDLPDHLLEHRASLDLGRIWQLFQGRIVAGNQGDRIDVCDDVGVLDGVFQDDIRRRGLGVGLDPEPSQRQGQRDHLVDAEHARLAFAAYWNEDPKNFNRECRREFGDAGERKKSDVKTGSPRGRG